MIGTTIVPVDETWTITHFRNIMPYPESEEILRANGLPRADNPFGTIGEQLRQCPVAEDLNLQMTEHEWYAHWMDTIANNMGDLEYAQEIASMDLNEYKDFINKGTHPGFLTVPSETCDRSEVVDRSINRHDIIVVKSAEHTPGGAPYPDSDKLDRIRYILQTLDPSRTVAPGNLQPEDTDVGQPGVGSGAWFWENQGMVTITIHYLDETRTLPIPAWPDHVRDAVTATWSQEMTTFQRYEPWQTYKGSGPRTVSCTFKIHRAMWDGNQDSGKCEELLSELEAANYPDYTTQSAEPPRVTLCVGKSIQVHGILTGFDKDYNGPIGPDGKYDCVDLNITITEESNVVLSAKTVSGSQLSGWR